MNIQLIGMGYIFNLMFLTFTLFYVCLLCFLMENKIKNNFHIPILKVSREIQRHGVNIKFMFWYSKMGSKNIFLTLKEKIRKNKN
jgi:hypothetical protein